MSQLAVKVWGKGCFYHCQDGKVAVFSEVFPLGKSITEKRTKNQILRIAATYHLIAPIIGTIVKLRKIKGKLTVYGIANENTVATFCERAVFLKNSKGDVYTFSFQTYYKLLEKTYAASYEKQTHEEISKKFWIAQKKGKARVSRTRRRSR